jgi:hypothetical protein
MLDKGKILSFLSCEEKCLVFDPRGKIFGNFSKIGIDCLAVDSDSYNLIKKFRFHSIKKIFDSDSRIGIAGTRAAYCVVRRSLCFKWLQPRSHREAVSSLNTDQQPFVSLFRRVSSSVRDTSDRGSPLVFVCWYICASWNVYFVMYKKKCYVQKKKINCHKKVFCRTLDQLDFLIFILYQI